MLKFDEPKKQSRAPKNLLKYSAFFLLIPLIAFIGTTLASNISINSGPIEFGQGVAQTAACSGTDFVTVAPYSEFVNAAGDAGAHYLASIEVSHIPTSCIGSDFLISVYNGTDILLIDGAVETVRVVYVGNSTNFVYSGKTGTYQMHAVISNATDDGVYGSFTVQFTRGRPLASDVTSVTLETTAGSSDTSTVGLLNSCVQNQQGTYTRSDIIALLGYSTLQEVETAVLEENLYLHVAGADGIPSSGMMIDHQDLSNKQELFCGNAQDNIVYSLDSEHDSHGVFRQDLFLGGAGDDTLNMAWNAIFYGGLGIDSMSNIAEGGTYVDVEIS